jgi:MFS family permease
MSEEIAEEVKKSAGYREVLKQKEFMKLIIANVINRFGDSVDSIAFTWLVYALTNSPAWSAVIFGINRIPTIFLQPFAGAMVESRNKKLIMVLMDFIRGICVSVIAVLYILKLLNPWILIAVTLIISSAEAFRGPAGTAVLPKILDKNCFEFGLSLNATLSNVVELAGLAAAGAIIALFGTQVAIFLDAATFWGSACIILFVRTGEGHMSGGKIDVKEYFDTLKGGINYIRKNRIIINFILIAMTVNGILVPLNSLLAPLVTDILKQGEYLLSVLTFSLTLGMIIGSVLYPYIAKKISTRTLILIGGIILSLYYISLVLCGFLSSYKAAVYLICMATSFLTGCVLSFLLSALNIQFMKQVETEYLARVSAIMNSGCVCTIPAASFAVSIFTALLPISIVFFIVGCFGMAIFIVVYLKKLKFE